MIDVSDAKQFLGQTLSDSDGGKVGKIGQIYLDDFNGQPEWVTVHTGLFGTNESFVPLAEADKDDKGLRVPYSKKQIQDAPNIDQDGELTEAQEQDLYKHYGVPFTTEGSTFADTSRLGQSGTASTGTASTTSTTGTNGTDTRDASYTDRDTASSGRDASYADNGHDTSGPNTDDAITRSEERLDVGTERVQTGKARLRKWVETENVQVDVPVKKEKARLVSEPITEGNRGDALSGSDITEEEHEVTLSEERPSVSKETVPVERVRLEKDVVEDTETVNDEVRKERVEFDDGTAGRDRA